jgi:hypothetical protein
MLNLCCHLVIVGRCRRKKECRRPRKVRNDAISTGKRLSEVPFFFGIRISLKPDLPSVGRIDIKPFADNFFLCQTKAILIPNLPELDDNLKK